MTSKNQRLQEKSEVEAKKAESKRRFKTLKLRTAEEMKKKGRAGKMYDDQKTLNEVLFEYLFKLNISLSDGKNMQECCYWCETMQFQEETYLRPLNSS